MSNQPSAKPGKLYTIAFGKDGVTPFVVIENKDIASKKMWALQSECNSFKVKHGRTFGIVYVKKEIVDVDVDAAAAAAAAVAWPRRQRQRPQPRRRERGIPLPLPGLLPPRRRTTRTSE